MRSFPLFIGLMACCACAPVAVEVDGEMVADQLVQMEAGIRCLDNAQTQSQHASRQLFEECLGLSDAEAALKASYLDDDDALRFHAWLVWDNAQGIEALGHQRLSYADWSEAADFAKCVEAHVVATIGFAKDDADNARRSLGGVDEICEDHTKSPQALLNKPLDTSDPEVRSKMLASSLANMVVLAALSRANACAGPCLTSIEQAPQDNAPLEVPMPAAEPRTAP